MWLIATFIAFSSKVAKTVGYVAIVAVLTAALIALFSSLLSPLSQTLPAGSVALAAAILPSNLNACISVVISARIARWVYDRNMKIADKLSE
ncbi:DUF5455 family protein [Nitrosomonas sp.]|uniref:DUF5455 family protein n=1 Tax=Nitrosomonas sp. TaxID=42353 RepID=UPI0035CCDD0F